MEVITNSEDHELWGGAVKCRFPNKYIDVSQRQEVPDNQEIFVHNEKDNTLIFEIVEPCEEDDSECCAFYFSDLVSLNEADDAKLLPQRSIEGISTSLTVMGAKCFLACGTQTLNRRYNISSSVGNPSQEVIQVIICVIRLSKYNSDILISYNGLDAHEETAMIDSIVKSFVVLNPSLFGEDDK